MKKMLFLLSFIAVLANHAMNIGRPAYRFMGPKASPSEPPKGISQDLAHQIIFEAEQPNQNDHHNQNNQHQNNQPNANNVARNLFGAEQH